MEDITPKLLNIIQKDFREGFDKSDLITKLYAKVRDGTATYKEANAFSIEVGELLAEAYSNNLSSEVLPDGKMYYNIAKRIIEPTVQNNYELITDITSLVQKALNDEAGIGIKPIVPELNEDRIKGIIDRISSEDIFDEIKWILEEPIVNLCQSIVDDSIRVNSEFHGKSGMSPKIIRKIAGNCCEWCRKVAGTYDYPDVPKDVYRRHQRCRCTVEYYPSNGKVQNVHTKEQWNEQNYLMVKGSKKSSLTDEKMGTINLIEIDGYSNVYVEDGVKIKPKALHSINKNIENAIKYYGENTADKPAIAIVDKTKLKGALGKYDCVKNIIFVIPDAGDVKMLGAFSVLDKTIKMGSTEYHEVWHWIQAKSYKKSITEDNRNTEYMPWLMRKCKKNIVSLGINEYNVTDISPYAANAFCIGRYDEVEAEYYSLRSLRR